MVMVLNGKANNLGLTINEIGSKEITLSWTSSDITYSTTYLET